MGDKNNNQNPGFWNWGKGLTVIIVLFVATTLSVVFYLVSLDYYMVSENHYEQAVEYQQQIDRIEHTSELEHPIEINRSNSRDIQILFPDSLASLNPTGKVKLYRPSDSNLDRLLELRLDTDGRQIIPGADLQKGKWRVQVTWKSDNKEFFEEATIFL